MMCETVYVFTGPETFFWHCTPLSGPHLDDFAIGYGPTIGFQLTIWLFNKVVEAMAHRNRWWIFPWLKCPESSNPRSFAIVLKVCFTTAKAPRNVGERQPELSIAMLATKSLKLHEMTSNCNWFEYLQLGNLMKLNDIAVLSLGSTSLSSRIFQRWEFGCAGRCWENLAQRIDVSGSNQWRGTWCWKKLLGSRGNPINWMVTRWLKDHGDLKHHVWLRVKYLVCKIEGFMERTQNRYIWDAMTR